MSAPLGKGQIPSLPALTLRRVAKDLRALSYLPTSWKGLLGSHSQVIQQQLEPLLVEMVKEGAHPRLMALLLERLADAQESLQAERNAWSFVCSGPDHLKRHVVDEIVQKVKHSVAQTVGCTHRPPYIKLLSKLMALPGSQHSQLNVLAKVEQSGQQLVFGDGTAAQQQRDRPTYRIVESKSLNAFKTLGRQRCQSCFSFKLVASARRVYCAAAGRGGA
jgi:hypothetical protein